VPPPHLPKDTVSAQQTQEIINAVNQRAGKIQTWKGLSRTVIEKEDDAQKSTLRQVILFSAPDRLRLDNLAPGSAYTLSLLAAESGRVVFLDTQEQVAVHSNQSGRMIEKALGLPLDVPELLAYLSGSVPAGSLAESAKIYHDSDAAQFVLVVAGRYYFLDSKTLQLKSAHVRTPNDDDLEYQIEFYDYREVENVFLPERIKMWIPRERLNLTLSFSNLMLNSPMRTSLFAVEIPASYKQREY